MSFDVPFSFHGVYLTIHTEYWDWRYSVATCVQNFKAPTRRHNETISVTQRSAVKIRTCHFYFVTQYMTLIKWISIRRGSHLPGTCGCVWFCYQIPFFYFLVRSPLANSILFRIRKLASLSVSTFCLKVLYCRGTLYWRILIDIRICLTY